MRHSGGKSLHFRTSVIRTPDYKDVGGKNYVSLYLVHPCRVNRGRFGKVGHAYAYDDFLDYCVGNNRLNNRRRGDSSLRPSCERAFPSSRDYLFDAWSDSRSLHLLQAEDPFPTRWVRRRKVEIRKWEVENCERESRRRGCPTFSEFRIADCKFRRCEEERRRRKNC